jgi:hypothetical protein
MIPRHIGLTGLVLCFCLLAAGPAPGLAAGTDTETPPTLSAAALLPAAVLSGPHHTVDEVVHNDGYLNIYTLHSQKGDLRVESTALLMIRIHELNAAAAMDQTNKGKEFGKSVAASGVGTVKGAVNLLVHPVDTLSGAASGVGKAFGRAAASLSEQRPRDDDGAGAELLGYNRAKREYAKAFGVDPYSRNPILQDSLKRLAGAGFAGGLTGTVAKAAIPGGVGVAVTAVGGTKLLNDIDVSTPPEDLLQRNRERLQAMGVPKDVIELFIENRHFSPTGQSRLVAALDRIPNVMERPVFMRFCVLTDDEDLAFFRERMAELYANINATTDRLERFVAVGKLVAARTAKGGFICAYPLDYLAWTPTMARLAQSLGQAATAAKATTKKLIVSGEVSPLAAAKLRAAGWTVVCLREGLAPARSGT